MLKKIFKKKEIGILLIIIAVCVIITIVNPAFLRLDNITTVITTNEVLGICALGMLLVMLTGGIDVSIGWLVTGVAVVIGWASAAFGLNLPVLIIIAMIAGGILGSLNGLIIAYFKLPPTVGTLGTMSLYNGLVLLVTNGKYIRGLPDYISGLGQQYMFKLPLQNGGFAGIPYNWLFWVAAIIITAVLLRYTSIGRSLYAVGGNPESAQRIGINPKRTVMFAYIYEGIMCGLAAIVSVGINRQVDPLAFNGYEMDVIAAVVIGGVSMAGGKGSVLGTVLGVLFMAVVQNGMVLMYIPTFYQKIVIGLVIIVSVTVDIMQQTIKESKIVKVDIKE